MFKCYCSDSENEFELIRFCQVRYSIEIICDWIYSLITTNGRNKSTGFCYHILFEGTVNEANRMLLCSYGSKLQKTTEQYLKNLS